MTSTSARTRSSIDNKEEPASIGSFKSLDTSDMIFLICSRYSHTIGIFRDVRHLCAEWTFYQDVPLVCHLDFFKFTHRQCTMKIQW